MRIVFSGRKAIAEWVRVIKVFYKSLPPHPAQANSGVAGKSLLNPLPMGEGV
jgi:hypothetical protein